MKKRIELNHNIIILIKRIKLSNYYIQQNLNFILSNSNLFENKEILINNYKQKLKNNKKTLSIINNEIYTIISEKYKINLKDKKYKFYLTDLDNFIEIEILE